MFLSAQDIYIQPSLIGDLSFFVLEAMAAGLPIICSDAGGLKDIIHNNMNGILYKSGDSSSLYKMFFKILSMKSDELRQLGRNSRDIAQNLFSLSNFEEEYKTIYNFKEKNN